MAKQNNSFQGRVGGRGGRNGRGVPARDFVPRHFDKGERMTIPFFTFLDVNDIPFVGAQLSDGAIIVPDTFGEFRFVPEADSGKEYDVSVKFDRNGNGKALPYEPGALSPTQEWVREARKAVAAPIIEGVVRMTRERGDRQPRPYVTDADGRMVYIDRAFVEKVTEGQDVRVSVFTTPRAPNMLLGRLLPAKAPARAPARPAPVDRLVVAPAPKAAVTARPAAPVQPGDLTQVTTRYIQRKHGVASAQSYDDLIVDDKQVTIYRQLTNGQQGIVTTEKSTAGEVAANAGRILEHLQRSLGANPTFELRERLTAYADAVRIAEERALQVIAAGLPADGAPAQESRRRHERGNETAARGGATIAELLAAKGIEV